MIPYKTQQEIYFLYHVCHLSILDIAQNVGVSRNTVPKYIDGPILHRPKKRGKPEVLKDANKNLIARDYASTGSIPVLASLMTEEPEKYGLLPGVVVTIPTLSRFIARHDLRVREPPREINSFEYVPGDLIEIDFTFAFFTFADGIRRKLCFFLASYPFSGKSVAYICRDLTMPSWYLGLNLALCANGVPIRVLCDNDKSLVISNTGYGNLQLNPHFESLCSSFNMKIVPCKPRSPQTKGVVERWGKTLKDICLNRIATKYRDVGGVKSVHQLQRYVNEWIKEYGDHRPCRHVEGMDVEEAYQTFERPALRVPNDSALRLVHSGEFGVYLHCILVYGQVFDLGADFTDASVIVSIIGDMSLTVTNKAQQLLMRGKVTYEQMRTMKFQENLNVEKTMIRAYISSCIENSADRVMMETPELCIDALATDSAELEVLHNSPAAHVEPPKAPTAHVEPPKAPAAHVEPSEAPAAHVEPPKAPAVHVEPPKAPAAHVEPPKAPAAHVEPPKASAAHVEPPEAPSSRKRAQKTSTKYISYGACGCSSTDEHSGNAETNTSIVRNRRSHGVDNRDVVSAGKDAQSASDKNDKLQSFLKIIRRFDSL